MNRWTWVRATALSAAGILIVSLLQVVPATADTPDDQDTSSVLDLPALPSGSPVDQTPDMPVGEFTGPEEIPQPVQTMDPNPKVIEAPDLATSTVDKAGLSVESMTENTTTYKRADGANVQRISQEPLNVRLDDGKWSEISTDVQKVDGGWQVPVHPLRPRFADRADRDDAVTVTSQGHLVSFALTGIGAGRTESPFWPWDEKDTLAYRGVAAGTDLEYDIQAGAVKETVVLNEVPSRAKPSWTWRMSLGDLTPKLVDGDAVQLLDRSGAVVMMIPTPFAEDSSGIDGERSPATSALKVTLSRGVGVNVWRYTISADAEWLKSKDRVYPVRIDPTFNVGPYIREAYKSDGTHFSGVLHVGNTRENYTNRYWRSIVGFDYGGIPGNFIAGAQIGIGYAGYGTTSPMYGNVRHASAFDYNGTGSYVTDYTLGTGWIDTGGWAVAQRLADRFAVGDRPAWMISGDEGSTYSHKQIDADIWIEYWGYPTPYTGAPANGAVVGLTPTLNASASNPGGRGQAFGFDISTDSTFTNTSVSMGSGWVSDLPGRYRTGSCAPVRSISGAHGCTTMRMDISDSRQCASAGRLPSRRTRYLPCRSRRRRREHRPVCPRRSPL
ncbi:hypothetical protein [uncultured Microbacterium sp.]|uniref:hypothetical protein n=1 Tax=uncultured Microbacterium sp. TaxID=191216 RepID=UPI0035CA2B09